MSPPAAWRCNAAATIRKSWVRSMASSFSLTPTLKSTTISAVPP
jgi:hypothetical protein